MNPPDDALEDLVVIRIRGTRHSAASHGLDAPPGTICLCGAGFLVEALQGARISALQLAVDLKHLVASLRDPEVVAAGVGWAGHVAGAADADHDSAASHGLDADDLPLGGRGRRGRR